MPPTTKPSSVSVSSQATVAEQPAIQPQKSAAKTKPSKVEKVKKSKLVRDSFTMPKDEYALIDALKTRGIALKQPVKKSELLRAGIKLLNGLSDASFLKAVRGVPALKTGRPGKTPA